MKQYLLQLFFLLFAIQVVIAQQFPVQVIPQTIPPRPVVLSDYANASSVNDKVRVQLILNDLTELNREVRLKLFIEGQGINAQSNDVVVGATPIFLEGGVATTLGTAQLAPYFDLQNLQGISPGVYGNSLPEGSYSFCFEVYDLFTGNVVSAKTCTNFVLFDNDPPLLNLPLNAVGIQEMNPLNIVFQWTPRHINVSNVQYELIVSEIWDLNIDPQAAFLSSPPIFQTTTTQTTFIYDGLQPSLIPGKRYGWRVRAFAAAGAEEIGVFTNNGFSEIFYFDYQTQCDEPLFPDVDELTNRSAKLIWQGNFDHLDYTVKYREKDAESEWYDLNTPREYADIDNLNAETTYEYKIQGNCMFGSYGETFIQEFTTLSDEASSYQGCAIEPEPILLENQERLTELFLYDNFTAGKFKVRVLEVENSSSPFKGKGYVTIPWLGFITIAAEFENIELNTDKELISGAVVTTYDPDWGNIVNTNGLFNDVFGNNGDIIQYDASDMVISDVQVSADGAITLIDSEGNSVPIVVGTPVIITDSNNNQWLVTNDGEVVELGPAAEGGVVTSDNTNGVNSSGSVTAISSQDVAVTFTDSGFYAFDPLPAGASSSLASEYNSISQASGGTYDVPYKAISDITGHTTDFLEGNVTFANGKTKSDLIFKTTEGTAIDTTWSGNTVSLSLTRQFEFGKTAILATVKPADSTGNYDIAGTADLWNMSAKTVNVTVVPINGSSTGTASQIQTELNTIYEKVGISFNVDLKNNFEVPANEWDIGPTIGSLDVGDSGVFSNYSAEENAIKNYYKDNHNIEDDEYYMFVFNNVPIINEDPSKNTQGFMPLKRQYGFVFNNSTTTMAHELGHGVFGLEHYTEDGTDSFLMHEDSVAGTLLPHMDWQTIHAAGLQLYLFQGDSDGESVVINGIPERFWNTDETITFMTLDGNYITLPNSVRRLTFVTGLDNLDRFAKLPTGALSSFQLNNKIYKAEFTTGNDDVLDISKMSLNYSGFKSIDEDFPLNDSTKVYSNRIVLFKPEGSFNKLIAQETTERTWDPQETVNIISDSERFNFFYNGNTVESLTIAHTAQSSFLGGYQLQENLISEIMGTDEDQINWNVGDKYLIISKIAILYNAYPVALNLSIPPTLIGYPSDKFFLRFKHLNKDELNEKYFIYLNAVKTYSGVCVDNITNASFETSLTTLYNCLSILSNEELKELSVENKLLIFSLMLDNWTLHDDREKQLIRLLKFTKRVDTDNLLEGLNGASVLPDKDYNLLRRLVYKTDNDHTYFHEDNYKELINVIADLNVNKSTLFGLELEDLSEEDLVERSIKFHYRGFWDQIFGDYQLMYNFLSANDLYTYDSVANWADNSDETAATIEIYTRKYAGASYLSSTDPLIIHPYSPIFFFNKSNLSLLSDYNSNQPILSPAIVAFYADDIGNTKTIIDGIQATIDVASIATGAGALANAPSITRKVFIIADMIGSGVSITQATVGNNLSQEGQAFLDALNILTASIAITDISNSLNLKTIFTKAKSLNSPLPTKAAAGNFLDKIIQMESSNKLDELATMSADKLQESKVWIAHLEMEKQLDHIDDLSDKIANAKRILNGLNELSFLDDFPNALNKFNSLNPSDKVKFLQDFKNADLSIMTQLNKSPEDSVLFEAWKNFTNKYPNRPFNCG